ncbi:hypothetical protein [Pedobacter alpinus]|uniref:Uncharacterized protein n=1 Tax=Pedobacter alpinus TaxID=1590643 RepID=A0ABW5TWQ6_9SPHI
MNWNKLKITPLTLVIAFCFTYVLYCLLGFEVSSPEISNFSKIGYTLALALVLFFTDILFRRFIESKKWIWLIQGSFILLIVIMMLIFKN